MSAFLVGEKTINKILTLLDKRMKSADGMNDAWVTEEFEPATGVNCLQDNWRTALGQKMLDLNQLSLKYRYGDKERKLAYTYHPVPCSDIEAFKALQCWIYQCTEGDIPERSELYKFFDQKYAIAGQSTLSRRARSMTKQSGVDGFCALQDVGGHYKATERR